MDEVLCKQQSPAQPAYEILARLWVETMSDDTSEGEEDTS